MFALAISIVASLAQLSFQVAVIVLKQQQKNMLESCNETATILRQIGFEKIYEANVRPINIARLILPEILSLLSCIIAYVVCVVLKSASAADEHNDSAVGPNGAVGMRRKSNSLPEQELTVTPAEPNRRSNVSHLSGHPASAPPQVPTAPTAAVKLGHIVNQIHLIASRFSEIITVLGLIVIAEIYPSVISAVYFLCVITLLTWWAAHLRIHSRFLNKFRIFVMVLVSLHMLFLYLYQIPGLFAHLPPDELPAR